MTTSILWDRLRYSLYGPVYDPVLRRLDVGRRRAVELADPQSGERVLIPGCGTDLDFPMLPPGAEIVAGDVAPGMVRAARSRADRLGLDVDVHVLDAHRLDPPDDSFDVVLLHLLLAVAPDPEVAIRETASGRRSAADWRAPSPCSSPPVSTTSLARSGRRRARPDAPRARPFRRFL